MYYYNNPQGSTTAMFFKQRKLFAFTFGLAPAYLLKYVREPGINSISNLTRGSRLLRIFERAGLASFRSRLLPLLKIKLAKGLRIH